MTRIQIKQRISKALVGIKQRKPFDTKNFTVAGVRCGAYTTSCGVHLLINMGRIPTIAQMVEEVYRLQA